MINSLNFSLFPSDELFTFSKGALTIIGTKKDSVPAIIPFYDKTSQLFVLYQAALEREKKNPFTTLLADKDGVRDGTYMGFRTLVEAASYRAKPGWNAAASKILEIIRRHGWSAASLGNKAETAAINNMISEIRSKCATELVTIRATEWLDELESAEKAFEAVAHQSVTATTGTEPTIWEIRPQLTNAIKSLFSMISLLSSGTPNADFTTLETALNELIVRSLATVKAAGTRAENKKKEEEQPK